MKRYDEILLERSRQSLVGISSRDFVRLVGPKCQSILTVPALEGLLDEQRALRVKFGIDPTASDVHLGHAVPIILLGLFARAGHAIDLIIGDFTARIGDPTARETGRVPLTDEQITANMTTYAAQIGRFIDPDLVRFHKNSVWLGDKSLEDVFGIFQSINLGEALQRDDFRQRIRNSQGVSLAEVCYGVLMGMDSLHLRTDIEIGGLDQLLNFQQSRKVMKNAGMNEEVVLMTPILEGTSGDGRKMSKSYNNYIAVESDGAEKFGKVMSIPDNLIVRYFLCFGDIYDTDVAQLESFAAKDPYEAKKQLATLIVGLANGEAVARKEREEFERKFAQKAIDPSDCLPVFTLADETIFALLADSGRFPSRSQLRSLFQQKAVRSVVKGTETVLEMTDILEPETIVRAGRREFFIVKTKGN